MTALSQLKNVNWHEDERVDLDDLRAMSELKDADLREVLLGFMEPPANGRVFKGMTGAAGVGLNFNLDAVDGLAIASDGSLLEVLSAAPPSTALPASATVYVHAYLVEQDSDLDNRRFLNDIPVPPEEVTQNVSTRQTKVVGLHVTSNADVTPLLGSFQTSAFISGKTRQLVALYAMKTDGVGVIGGSIVDFRQLWLPGGNQVPLVNGGIPEFPFVIGSATVVGLRSAFRAVAQTIRELASNTANEQWWDTAPVRTDPEIGTVKPTLRDRIHASRTDTVTVSPTLNRADLQVIQAAVATLGGSKKSVFLKAGTYTFGAGALQGGNLAFNSTAANMGIRGAGTHQTFIEADATATLPLLELTGLADSLVVEDITFSCAAAVAALVKIDITSGAGERITFRNCRFTTSAATPLILMTTAPTNSRIHFDNCTFEFNSSGALRDFRRQVLFTNCRFVPLTTNAQIVGVGDLLAARFYSCEFGNPSGAVWNGFGVGGILSFECFNCRFNGVNFMASVSSTLAAFFHGCFISGTTGGGATTLFTMGGAAVALVLFLENVTVQSHGAGVVTSGATFNTLVVTGGHYRCSGTAPMFEFTGTGGSEMCTFNGVAFDYSSNSADGACVRVARAASASSGFTLSLNGCTFDAKGFTQDNYAVALIGANGSSLASHISGCSFLKNNEAARVPIKLDGGSTIGTQKYTGVVSGCVWQTSVDGAITDPIATTLNQPGASRINLTVNSRLLAF